GVKADANPAVDNVAYTTPEHTGGVPVRGNELLGIWHGAMFNPGRVTTPTAFQAWARATELAEHRVGLLAALPPYSLTYDPTVMPQLRQGVVKVAGITGANGYYSPPQDPEQPRPAAQLPPGSVATHPGPTLR